MYVYMYVYINVLSPAYIYISHHAEVKSQLFQFIWLGSSWKSIFVLLNFENGAKKLAENIQSRWWKK